MLLAAITAPILSGLSASVIAIWSVALVATGWQQTLAWQVRWAFCTALALVSGWSAHLALTTLFSTLWFTVR